jgi:putative DNA primase/helicase
MQNGIIDIAALLRGEPKPMIPHTPLFFSSVCLPYPFDPDATCPKWLDCLDRNLEGDGDRISILQEFMGYCLVIDTSFQKFLVMTGDGGTGKSTACAVMTATLGCANVSHLPLEMFGQRFQMYQTLGKLANIAFDCGEIDKSAEGTIKSFTSGDRMTFERKFCDNVDAAPTARLILATNNLPRFSDRSSGIWRRLLLLPFLRVVPEQERVHGMDSPQWWEAQGELPGIFNWAIRGLQRLRERRRFTTSEMCEKELAEYRLECNPAGLFLREHFEADPQEDIVTQETYSGYAEWCRENGYRAMASNKFGAEIKRTFPACFPGKVYATDGRRVPGYKGLKKIKPTVEIASW